MKHTLQKLSLLGVLAVTPLGGCATIAGTAASPITGGVDLCVQALQPDEWYYAPFVFLGGAIGGPFVAFYNGVQYDAQVFSVSLGSYWREFRHVFRPWDQIL